MEEVVKEKKKRASREKVIPAKYPNLPLNVQEIDTEFLIDWCKANKQTKWLKEEVEKFQVDKNGEKRRYGLFQIRKDFAAKFMPNLLEVVKAPKDSFYNRVMALD